MAWESLNTGILRMQKMQLLMCISRCSMVEKYLLSLMRLLRIFQLRAVVGAATIMIATGIIIEMMGTEMTTGTMDTEMKLLEMTAPEMTASEMMDTGTTLGMMATGMKPLEMTGIETRIGAKMITLGEAKQIMIALVTTSKGAPAHVLVVIVALPPASKFRSVNNSPSTTGSTGKSLLGTCRSQLQRTSLKRPLRNLAASWSVFSTKNLARVGARDTFCSRSRRKLKRLSELWTKLSSMIGWS